MVIEVRCRKAGKFTQKVKVRTMYNKVMVIIAMQTRFPNNHLALSMLCLPGICVTIGRKLG